MGSRQNYFRSREILNNVLEVLNNFDTLSLEQLENIMHGLQLIAHVTEMRDKYLKPGLTLQAFEMAEKCQLLDMLELAPCDTDAITFIVEGQKITASKSMLISKSEIFAAMLEGHYSEANLSEIPIPETSFFAFRFLVHFLHGCQLRTCAVLRDLLSLEKTAENAVVLISLANEAEKYMIHSLKDLACRILHERFIVADSARAVFKFAVLHRKTDLMKAAVAAVLVNTKNCCETAEFFLTLLQSKYSDIFQQVLYEILTE